MAVSEGAGAQKGKMRDCPEGTSVSMWILQKKDFNFVLEELPVSKEFAIKTLL